MGLTSFTNDHTKIAEMEFYLIEELDFHLIVFHPYRALVQLCGRDAGAQSGGEQGRLARASMLEMDDTALQMAWFVINDTFRSSLCLVHPPHLIAIAAIYLAFSLHPPENLFSSSNAGNPNSNSNPTTTNGSGHGPASRTRRQSVDATNTGSMVSLSTSAANHPASNHKSNSIGGQSHPVEFLASLNIDHEIVLEIVQEIVSLYELWNALETSPSVTLPPNMTTAGATVFGGGGPSSSNKGKNGTGGATNGSDERVIATLMRMRLARHQELQADRDRGRGTPSWKR
ncbi:RNA polymerase II holoenzyme cyclin-like subunit [Microbotryomycetes sp. JL221]|nr:RNA polymerase II holoenzyme cyclin-like subunit [Microbotryomycetes sp. JL221]